MPRLGQHMSEETKARISIARMGHEVSVETREKISLAKTNPSPETRARMSAAQKRRVFSPEELARISAVSSNQSPETRAKISASHMGSLNWHWYGGRKVTAAKSHAKRKALGFVPLNARFEGCEGHHIDNERVIYMPRAIHRSVYHNQNTGRGMAQMNALALEWLAGASV